MATVHIDDDLAAIMQSVDEPVEALTREMIVMELYRRALISGGKAAELLGMDRRTFIRRADELEIPYFRLSKEDLEAEFRASLEL
jgi:predicted HTH domain antitoxin